MTKLFYLLLTIPACMLSFTSCGSKGQEHKSQLSQQQLDLLETPKAGTTVTFNENGTLSNHTLNNLYRNQHQTQFLKGGQFSPSVTYTNETGQVYYQLATNQYRIIVYAQSEDPYRTTTYPANQSVKIYDDLTFYENSHYRINFNNTIPSRTINGITYTDVVLGIDGYRNDTLFWKQGIGILGWKRASQNYTAYRVFN